MVNGEGRVVRAPLIVARWRSLARRDFRRGGAFSFSAAELEGKISLKRLDVVLGSVWF